jgi:hypothetical protein
MPMASGSRARVLWLALFLLALGAALRLAGARGDLWFDELWSLTRALLVERPLDVLLRPELRHDNNHWLNTLFLHWLGPDASPFAYRTPAWIASVLTLLVLWRIGWRRSPASGVLVLALAALSFLLVQYGSEARGYAGAVLCSVMCFAIVDGDRDADAAGRRALWRVPAFWAAALLGLASHLTFLYGYVALLVWHPLRLLRRSRPSAAGLRLALYHVLPVGVVAGLYFTTLRHIVIGGGPKFSIGQVVLETLGSVFGVPAGSPWAFLAAVGVGLVVVAELALRFRERDDTALFFPVVLVFAPALFLAVREPEILYVRYFLVCVPYFLLLFASLLARGWRAGGGLRLGAASVLLLTLAANALPVAGLLRVGRGQYSAAVRYLAENTAAGPIEIGVEGDHNLQLLSHHAAALRLGRELVFRDPGSPAPRAPQWILGDSMDPHFEPPPELRGPFGSRYQLAREFPFAGLSGLSWFVYRLSGDLSRAR